MKLIIDIPDYKLDEVQNGSIASNEILKAVRKGTPISTKGDLISRSELKKAVNDFFDNHFKGLVSNELITYAKAVDNAIDNAPTVNIIQQQDWYLVNIAGAKELLDRKRPKGEWIELRHYDYKCSICGDSFMDKWNYCGNCGADMRGETK